METIPPCPTCAARFWWRDGYRLRVMADGTIERKRVTPERAPAASWSCSSCGYAVPIGEILHARLNAAQLLDPEWTLPRT